MMKATQAQLALLGEGVDHHREAQARTDQGPLEDLVMALRTPPQISGGRSQSLRKGNIKSVCAQTERGQETVAPELELLA
jgi:hypothetical protein